MGSLLRGDFVERLFEFLVHYQPNSQLLKSGENVGTLLSGNLVDQSCFGCVTHDSLGQGASYQRAGGPFLSAVLYRREEARRQEVGGRLRVHPVHPQHHTLCNTRRFARGSTS